MDILYHFIRVHVREADVQDILQETLLSIWKGLPAFLGDANFKTWCISIARRRIADHFRRLYRRGGEEADLWSLREALAQESGEDGLLTGLWVQEALQTLKPSERELVFLLYQAGLSCKDAATLTGMPEGTVKSKMHAIRNKLRKQLQKGEETP